MKIRFTETARVSFLRHLAYIANDNPKAARDFRKNAASKLRRLQRFPSSGHRIPEFPELPHRQIVISPYRFFYRIVGKTVWIVDVWHGAQIPGKPSG